MGDMEVHSSTDEFDRDVQEPWESVKSQSVDSVSVEEKQFIHSEELKMLKQAVETGSLDSALQKINEHYEQLDKTELNIAVTGGSGKGKSTFINAIRGLGEGDEGSAPTGVVETTMESTSYPYPNNPSVIFWDLPGIGTENFTADQYMDKVEFSRYDFFIIISSERFTSYDAHLAREINKLSKHFFFIRSKIDNDMAAAKRKKKSEKVALDEIRQDCITGLQKLGIEYPRVFLISSYELEKYDFPEMQETLEKDLPEEKRHVFLLALPNITKRSIQKKKEVLQANIWKMALLSGTMSAVPIPGLDFTANVNILVKALSQYYKAFGLDEASLKRLSERSNVPVEELKKPMKHEYDQEVTADMVIKMLTKVTGQACQLAKYFLSQIPVLGSLPAGGIAFITNYNMLYSCLDELATVAHLVLMRAFPYKV